MLSLISFWSHAAVALLLAGAALWQARAPGRAHGPAMLVTALGLTAFWALATAAYGPTALPARLAEAARTLGWLGFMLALLLRSGQDDQRSSVVALYAVVAAVVAAQVVIDLAAYGVDVPSHANFFFHAMLLLRMSAAIGALLLVHNLYTAADRVARADVRLAVAALAAMWTYDLNLYTIAYLGAAWPGGLLAMRGLVTLVLVPAFTLAGRRDLGGRLQLSRAATFQSLSLMAIGAYLVAMVLIARAIERLGGGHAGLAQLGVVFGMSVVALVVLPDALRAWIKVKVVKHFFRHRYDYRTEWLRFTATLGRSSAEAGQLDVRVVQAVADITESPGGLLLLPDESGGLEAAARWNWPAVDPPAHAADRALVRHLEDTGRIVELDAARRDPAGPDAALLPAWVLDAPDAWAAVPLLHNDRLVGVVLLERPRVDRMLDWEDFDLLRVAGRQIASYLAEARGQEALSDARRFDEFNRRFAFIMHDIKNLVSQLGLLARNAERHADNPAFRADMIATLHASTAKMNELLARLSQHHRARAEEPRAVPVRALVEAVAAAKRTQHPVEIDGRPDLLAIADPARLEQALGHLVQNAIDASPPDTPVWLRIGRRGLEATIEVLDAGAGMDAEFIRNRLFKPFASTKDGGFGIGAFEARTLVAAMGGRLEVASREGEGSRFTIVLAVAETTPERLTA